MPGPGRPRKQARTITINIKLTLTEGIDDVLIARLLSVPSGRRAQWVKDILEGNQTVVKLDPRVSRIEIEDLSGLVM